MTKGETMDYTLILQSLQSTLEQKQKSYSAAVDRTAALAAELDRARAADAALAKEVEETRASVRGVELLIQQGPREEGGDGD